MSTIKQKLVKLVDSNTLVKVVSRDWQGQQHTAIGVLSFHNNDQPDFIIRSNSILVLIFQASEVEALSTMQQVWVKED